MLDDKHKAAVVYGMSEEVQAAFVRLGIFSADATIGDIKKALLGDAVEVAKDE